MFNHPPLSHRRGIDFYCKKSEAEFRKDPYERYREVVARQLALHCVDDFWDAYPFQTLIDWISSQLPAETGLTFLDVGCGVGRLLREVSLLRPDWDLVGIDYSYNLLQSCHQLWQQGGKLELDYRQRGWPIQMIEGSKIDRLQLGLAKADQLPLATNSLDVIVNTFLLDRLEHPQKALLEWHRVLRPGGQLLVLSPLNWQRTEQWHAYPDVAAVTRLLAQNWQIVDQRLLEVKEPLDKNGNFVTWKCYCWCCAK